MTGSILFLPRRTLLNPGINGIFALLSVLLYVGLTLDVQLSSASGVHDPQHNLEVTASDCAQFPSSPCLSGTFTRASADGINIDGPVLGVLLLESRCRQPYIVHQLSQYHICAQGCDECGICKRPTYVLTYLSIQQILTSVISR